MLIPVDKTEALVIVKDPIRCRVAVYDQAITQNIISTFLRIDVQKSKRSDLEKQVYI